MKHFSYKGRDSEGRLVSGVVEAVNEQNALVMLRPSVAVVIELKEIAEEDAVKQKKAEHETGIGLLDMFSSYNPSLADRAFLIYQISSMLDAGIDLVSTLDSLAEEYEDKKARQMLRDMAEHMRSGESFSEVLAHYPRIFPKVFVSVVSAGEESGKLPEVLASLSEQLDYLYKIRGKIIGAMIYPLITIVVAIMVVILMLVKILPIFEQIYGGYGADLPGPTLMLISISHFLRDNALLITLAVIIMIGLVRWMWSIPKTKLKMEALLYRIPVFGQIIREYIYVQTCRILSLLLRSGVHVIDSLRFTASSTPWLRFKYGILSTLEGVRVGESLADLFKKERVLPGIASRMLKVGEETGTLDDMLSKVGDFYYERVDNKIKTLASLVEPLLIVVLGAIISFLLIAMYLPVFMLGSAVTH